MELSVPACGEANEVDFAQKAPVNQMQTRRSGFRLERRSKEMELSVPACGEANEVDFAPTTCRCDGIGRRSGFKIHRQ